MHDLIKLGLAGLVVIGGTSLSFAQDAAKPAAGAKADPTTTSSVNANYGSLISSIQAGKSADLTTFNAGSTVECVKVSSLQGGGDAQALDNALTKNKEAMSTWQGTLSSNADFMTKVKTSCGLTADADVADILSIESGANGSFTVYFDDRS